MLERKLERGWGCIKLPLPLVCRGELIYFNPLVSRSNKKAVRKTVVN
jgi:hypothetical protein